MKCIGGWILMQEQQAEKQLMTPTEFFNDVKDRRKAITDEELLDIYDNCLKLLNKYKVTGQIDAAEKIIFHLEAIEKEREIVKYGLDTFVYKEDIEEFIGDVADEAVKIIELERYEREIPDEIVNTLEDIQHLFDRFYVVFTDYTGEMQKKVEKERQDKDPILFGTLQDKHSTIVNRFYYIGDWEDEYCDLTLDKMVSVMKSKTNKDIEMKIKTPEDINELKQQLKQIRKEEDGEFRMTGAKKNESFFRRIKTFFKR